MKRSPGNRTLTRKPNAYGGTRLTCQAGRATPHMKGGLAGHASHVRRGGAEWLFSELSSIYHAIKDVRLPCFTTMG